MEQITKQQQQIINTFKILTDEKPNFFIQQFYTQCIAEAAYYIESDGEAVVIDPLRDTFPYTQLAKSRKASIKKILLTHFHADFVSGHLDLQHKLGSTIVYGPTAKPNFKAHVAEHEEKIKLGKIEIQVLHTPGHTMESSSFLLLDGGKPYCIFSGDTLFLGEVGRPDLAVKTNEITKEDLAGYLFDSLQNVYMPLPDDVIVYPGHGAGSACGKNISQGTSDTLGNQKKTNYALQIKDRSEFVKNVSSNLPTPPAYFFHDAGLNKNGYDILTDVVQKNQIPLEIKKFKQLMKDGYKVIDSRDKYEYLKGFIKGSYSVDLKSAFASWIGKLMKATDKFIIVTADDQEYETVVRMCRVGYDQCAGYLKGGFETWKKDKQEFGVAENMEVKDFEKQYEKKGENDYYLDVRDANEKHKGYLEKFDGQEGVWQLESKLMANKDLFDKNKKIYCLCQSGQRSLPAISILTKYGYTKLVNISGGMNAIKESKMPVQYVENS